jgi:molybdopterin/thiamine biosynthesis adenylyltransferase
LISDVDVVLDGADNFPTRYLLSDACVNLAKPLVYGAVHRFEGQVSVFDAGRHRGEAPCYRCLFPEAPSAEDAPNCAEAGVLGVLPGIIGLLQATEALKLILELGESLSGRLLHFDALAMRFRETRLRPDPDCAVCAVGRQFPGYQYTAEWCRAG